MTQPALYQTDLKGLKLVSRGKVRDLYDLGEYLLIEATEAASNAAMMPLNQAQARALPSCRAIARGPMTLSPQS